MIEDSLWRFGALFGSLVPGLVIAIMLLRVGQRQLSPRLLVVAIASGVMIAVLPLSISAFEPVLRSRLEANFWFPVRAFGFAGLSEEGAKLLACYFIVAPFYQRRSRADLILACAGVGLGFALIENVSYVFRASDQWKAMAIARAISAVPMHAFLGLSMGYGLGAAEAEAAPIRRALKIVGTWLACATLHGLYDLPLFLGEILPLSLPFVGKVGNFLSVSTPTILSAVFLCAVTTYALGTIGSIAVCRRDIACAEYSEGRRNFQLSPALLDRIVFSKVTGLLLGGVLLLVACATEITGALATALGAVPTGVLNGSAIAIILGTFSWGVAGREFVALPGDIKGWKRALAGFSERRRLAAAAAATVGAGAILGSIYWTFVGLRYTIAFSLVQSGVSLANVGSVDRAISNYDSALSVVPDFLLAYQARADAYRIMQDYDRALADLERAVSLHPDNGGAYASLAQVHGLRHDHARAISALDRAVSLDPENPVIMVARGMELIEAGNIEEAGRDAEGALKLKPGMAAAHALRGLIFTERDEVSRAISEYGAAISADPKNSGSYFARGRLYFENRDFRAAADDFARAAATGERSYVILWLYLARSYLGQNGKRELAVWSEATAKNSWPFPLAELFLGLKPLARVAEAATTNDQKCEFAFYVGELQLFAKLEKDAAASLSRAKAICPNSFVETRLARKDSDRLQAAIDAAKARETFLQAAKTADAKTADAKSAASAATTSAATAEPQASRAIWHATPPDAANRRLGMLKVEGMRLITGTTAAFSIAASPDATQEPEFLINVLVKDALKKPNSDITEVSASVVGQKLSEENNVSMRLGIGGMFQGRLSKAAARQFAGELNAGRFLKVIFFGAHGYASSKYVIGETRIEIDDDARQAIAAYTQYMGEAPNSPPAEKAAGPVINASLASDAIAQDENVRRHLSAIRAEAERPSIFVEVVDAMLTSGGYGLVATLRVKNVWDQPVKFGELTVDAFRFLNPYLFKVIPTYPPSLLETNALDAPLGSIAAGETKTVIVTIVHYDRARAQTKPRGAEKFSGFLSFYGPGGQRSVAKISGTATVPAQLPKAPMPRIKAAR